MRVQDGTTPTKWNFQADPSFVWADKGKELVYDDSYVDGADHTTGAGGYINEHLDDLYNRVGYVKRLSDVSGNRGYSQNVIINSSRSLTPADSGLITVVTADVPGGGTQSASIVITLPSRASLISAGSAYFDRNTAAPYLDVQGGGLVPFMINGYKNVNGVPLKVSVANPTSPGTPVSGDDMAQTIVIEGHSTTDVYLYDNEYAEFIPVITRHPSSGLWYTTWNVKVHSSGYGKFTKAPSAVAVSSGAPSTNMEKKYSYFDFSMNTGDSLSYLPDNTTSAPFSHRNESSSSLLYIRVATNTSGDWTLTNNGLSAGTGFKKIFTPTGANMTMKHGDIIVLIEESTQWRVVNIIGSSANFAALYAAISGFSAALSAEATTRSTADVNEALARAAADTAISAKCVDAYDDSNNPLKLKMKVIPIGNWDMNANQTKNVAHGISDITKIRDVSAIVRNDASDKWYKLDTTLMSLGFGSAANEFDATNVVLWREAGGYFDGTSFDTASAFNRGYVTITYEA